MAYSYLFTTRRLARTFLAVGEVAVVITDGLPVIYKGINKSVNVFTVEEDETNRNFKVMAGHGH